MLDAEEVRDSNPLAPTSKGPGHRAFSLERAPARSDVRSPEVDEKLTRHKSEVRCRRAGEDPTASEGGLLGVMFGVVPGGTCSEPPARRYRRKREHGLLQALTGVRSSTSRVVDLPLRRDRGQHSAYRALWIITLALLHSGRRKLIGARLAGAAGREAGDLHPAVARGVAHYCVDRSRCRLAGCFRAPTCAQ